MIKLESTKLTKVRKTRRIRITNAIPTVPENIEIIDDQSMIAPINRRKKKE